MRTDGLNKSQKENFTCGEIAECSPAQEMLGLQAEINKRPMSSNFFASADGISDSVAGFVRKFLIDCMEHNFSLFYILFSFLCHHESLLA